MTIRQARRHFGRYNAAPVLLGLTVLGCIAVVLVVHALPTQNAASGSAPQSAILLLRQDAPGVIASVATGAATAAIPSAPTTMAPPRVFDYFPDHYVNQATKVEEPIATF